MNMTLRRWSNHTVWMARPCVVLMVVAAGGAPEGGPVATGSGARPAETASIGSAAPQPRAVLVPSDRSRAELVPLACAEPQRGLVPGTQCAPVLPNAVRVDFTDLAGIDFARAGSAPCSALGDHVMFTNGTSQLIERSGGAATWPAGGWHKAASVSNTSDEARAVGTLLPRKPDNASPRTPWADQHVTIDGVAIDLDGDGRDERIYDVKWQGIPQPRPTGMPPAGEQERAWIVADGKTGATRDLPLTGCTHDQGELVGFSDLDADGQLEVVLEGVACGKYVAPGAIVEYASGWSHAYQCR